MLKTNDRLVTAYITGIALGDGNLSNPNGRAIRLRITCDSKYPFLISKIERNLKIIAPDNKVSRVNRAIKTSIDISCYSNDWEKILGWKAHGGPKMLQRVSVPKWIFRNKSYIRACVCGLIETDGSIYMDRKYLSVNFVTEIENLANSFKTMLQLLGYEYSLQLLQLPGNKTKHTFRIHRNAMKFIREMGITKR